jgi:hypothetical protein
MIITLETLRGMQYSFQKVTQFSEGNNVEDITASNTLYFSIRHMCFSISTEEGTFNKMNDSTTPKSFYIASIPFTSQFNSNKERTC